MTGRVPCADFNRSVMVLFENALSKVKLGKSFESVSLSRKGEWFFQKFESL